nr:hypothetical protein [uncultured Allomuricauda sp.]
MKTYINILSTFLMIILLLIPMGCSKEEIVSPGQGEGEITTSGGTSTDRFDTYAGEIGFVLDTRELVKKGYTPVKAEIVIEAEEGNFSQTIDIDPVSFMGQIKLIKDELTQEAINELENGVFVTSVIKDADDQTITSDSLTTSFQSNPAPRKVVADGLTETDENKRISLSEDTSYYFQPIDEDDNPESGKSMVIGALNIGTANQSFIMTTASGAQFNGNEEDRSFSFVPIPGEVNTFAIRIKSAGSFLVSGTILNSVRIGPILIGQEVLFSHVGLATSTTTDFNLIQDSPNFHFKIEKLDEGIYELQNSSGTAVRMAPDLGLTFDMVVNEFPFGSRTIQSEPIRWRLISTTIDWEVQNVGTTFLEPILGEAETDFKYNSTLTNCGQGSLSQTVGVNVEEEEIGTLGWEESLSINTTNSVSVSTTIGVEFDAKFFGKGAKYNASITAGYDYSRSVEESSTQFEERTEEVGTKVFSERTVTVPPGSASLVYDAFQFYGNTKVNFVQRLRVSGVDSQTGELLSGQEVRSQFQFNSFDGIISAVEPNSIVITLSGTTEFEQIIEIESKVEDVDPNCGG